MNQKIKHILLAAAAVLLLLCWVMAIPSGRVTDEAEARYSESEISDDEYDFLE